MKKAYFLSVAALSVFATVNPLQAARDEGKNRDCGPTPPMNCYPDDCKSCYCLGPENYGGNPPTGPRTCNGDLAITVAGFYWNAHQDGMGFALTTPQTTPLGTPVDGGTLDPTILPLNNVAGGSDGANYHDPNFKWNFGFKLGLGYTTTCDGWDVGVLWTWYRGKADSHIEAEADDNETLLPIWSAFSPPVGAILFATDIEAHWKLHLNLVDIELGRSFWTSRYLILRPNVGIRIAFLTQDFDVEHKGGSWARRVAAPPLFDALNNEVEIDNNFKGAGLRAGLDSIWNIGCGFGFYGNLNTSLVYGRFFTRHEERNREAVAPFGKTVILQIKEHFRASRAMVDLALGVQWSALFCDCKYGMTAMLGWEQHLFFGQNQMWRVNRIGDVAIDEPEGDIINNTGENIFVHSRGDLNTQGWTLTLAFEF